MSLSPRRMSRIAVPSFSVEATEEGEGFSIRVQEAGGPEHSYLVPTGTQQDFSRFFEQLSRDFGTRMPDIFAPAVERPAPTMRWSARKFRAKDTYANFRRLCRVGYQLG